MRALWIIVLGLGASIAQGQTTRTDCYGYGNSIHCDSRDSGVSDQLGRSLSRSMAPDILGSFERGRQEELQRQLLEEQQRQLQLQNQLLQQQLQQRPSSDNPGGYTELEIRLLQQNEQLRKMIESQAAQIFGLQLEAISYREQLKEASAEAAPAAQDAPKPAPVPTTHH